MKVEKVRVMTTGGRKRRGEGGGEKVRRLMKVKKVGCVWRRNRRGRMKVKSGIENRGKKRRGIEKVRGLRKKLKLRQQVEREKLIEGEVDEGTL